MDVRALLVQIKARLSSAYGERLRGVVLYGSAARGEATEDSDVDVLVLLDGPAQTWEDVHLASDALLELMIESGRIIDAMPVDERLYREGEAPLYAAARNEGVRA